MNTIGVILAGGVGNRFDPFTTSKPLFTFLGQPLLGHNLSELAQVGLEDIIIIVNQKNHAAIKDIHHPNLNITLVEQPEALGMADAIIRAKPLIGSRPILIRNVTNAVETHLFQQLSPMLDGSSMAITAIRSQTYFPGGYLEFTNNRLTGIVEKPGEGREPSDLIKRVFDYFPNGAELIEVLETTRSEVDDVYEHGLTQLFSLHEPKIIEYEGNWQSLKYPWHVIDMMNIFLAHRLTPSKEGASIHPMALVEDSVYLAPGVKVLPGAVIIGKTYIGPNTLVGNNALVRDSHIGGDCEIGYNTEVVRSYIGDGCKLHTAYVGDSVLEGNSNFGAGAKTANLRFDDKNIHVFVKGQKVDTGKRKLGALIGQHVSVGINSSLMPGIKIDEYAIIGPHTLVNKDVVTKEI
jgi:UDP-N-acetylglucosamine diphosphorylase / glucose-1-phosphate thymidylyltransferase / UDP-N-acetylgalactosamine diphosphorylase / glucosamine-1-phosphate N-acetyltransferase / galactosamine-1-phosphate N-acetyltransferase